MPNLEGAALFSKQLGETRTWVRAARYLQEAYNWNPRDSHFPTLMSKPFPRPALPCSAVSQPSIFAARQKQATRQAAAGHNGDRPWAADALWDGLQPKAAMTPYHLYPLIEGWLGSMWLASRTTPKNWSGRSLRPHCASQGGCGKQGCGHVAGSLGSASPCTLG